MRHSRLLRASCFRCWPNPQPGPGLVCLTAKYLYGKGLFSAKGDPTLLMLSASLPSPMRSARRICLSQDAAPCSSSSCCNSISQILASEPLIRFPVLSRCLFRDLGGQFGAGGRLVPVQSLQIVAGTNCLSKESCDLPGLYFDCSQKREESGVRALINQDQLAVKMPELELGVGDDQAALGGIGAAKEYKARLFSASSWSSPHRPPRRPGAAEMFMSWPDAALVAA